MRRLFFVGDGPRDEVTVPSLVTGILEADFSRRFRPWARLHLREKAPAHRLKGYGRRLLLAMKQARDNRADGLVATIDYDKGKEKRLRDLRNARRAHGEKWPGYPVALGQAVPHAEAWLLDDQRAVREGLRLASNHAIPAVTKCGSPKVALEELHGQSERRVDRPLAVWCDIARHVDVSRCAHKKQTGFGAFVEEVKAELGPLFGEAS